MTSGFTQAYPSQHRRACLLTKGCPCLLLALIQHGLLPRCFFFFTFICQVPQNSSSYLRDHFPKRSEAKIKWTTGRKKKRISSHNDDKTSNTAANATRILNKEGQLPPQTWVLSNEPNWQATYSEFTFGNTTWLGRWNFQRSHKDVWKVAAVLKLETLALWGGLWKPKCFSLHLLLA